MIKKILLAYDGSSSSHDAAEKAAEIAKRFDAEVTVLTVGGPLFGGAAADAPIQRMGELDYEKVADEGVALLVQKQVRTHKIFRWVDPADQILNEAQAGGYDMIIMGHRSAKTSIQRGAGLLGSVAIKVINNAPCSVLVIRPTVSTAKTAIV